MQLTIAIPAYDEVTTLESVLDEALVALQRLPFPDDAEILVVDDGSTDGTGQRRALPQSPDHRPGRSARAGH